MHFYKLESNIIKYLKVLHVMNYLTPDLGHFLMTSKLRSQSFSGKINLFGTVIITHCISTVTIGTVVQQRKELHTGNTREGLDTLVFPIFFETVKYMDYNL